jgi:hypothetical protein
MQCDERVRLLVEYDIAVKAYVWAVEAYVSAVSLRARSKGRCIRLLLTQGSHAANRDTRKMSHLAWSDLQVHLTEQGCRAIAAQVTLQISGHGAPWFHGRLNS